jgi:hypothetical protein
MSSRVFDGCEQKTPFYETGDISTVKTHPPCVEASNLNFSNGAFALPVCRSPPKMCIACGKAYMKPTYTGVCKKPLSHTRKDRINRLPICWYCRWCRKATIPERVMFVMSGEDDRHYSCTHPGFNIKYRHSSLVYSGNKLCYCHWNIKNNRKYNYYYFGNHYTRWMKRLERQQNRHRQNESVRLGNEVPVFKHGWLD